MDFVCGTLHSVGYILPFLPCLLLLFFSQLFVKPPQTTTLPSYISFSLCVCVCVCVCVLVLEDLIDLSGTSQLQILLH